MRFTTLPLNHALGALLAHSLATPDGTVKKGRPLSSHDIERLRVAGHTTVFAAHLEQGDIGEDAAAAEIAARVAGPNTTVAQPFTGRANIFAATAGLATIDTSAIARLNAVHESVTIATVPPFERVAAGQMLATIKIIPFAVTADTMDAARKAAIKGAVSLAAWSTTSPALILTQLAASKPSVLAKRDDVIAARLQKYGASIAHRQRVPHTVNDVAEAITRAAEVGHHPILVFAASAIVDRADVVPEALNKAGGEVHRLGMPVDPGNLLLYGTLGKQTNQNPRVVIGIPSCAASPKLNGFDWVLDRVMAGIPITPADIAMMGVGGLLKEISSRPQPREGSTTDEHRNDGRQASKIAGILLAGGRSSRMGGVNKLLQVVAGKPIVRHTAEAILASVARPVVVVLGHNGAGIRDALKGLDVSFVENPRYADGISTSLKVGLCALPETADGAIVALADMPEVPAALYDRMIAAYAPKEGRSIVMPTYDGKRGNPVLWDRRFIPEMMAVSGDTGAKHLLGLYAEEVAEIDAGAPHVLTDIDTPDALAALKVRAEL